MKAVTNYQSSGGKNVIFLTVELHKLHFTFGKKKILVHRKEIKIKYESFLTVIKQIDEKQSVKTTAVNYVLNKPKNVGFDSTKRIECGKRKECMY